MKTELIKIGNSRGIRIPKPLIDQCGFRKTVELRVEDDNLIISPEHQPRQGWREAFRSADAGHQEERLLPDFPNAFDEEEWQW